MGTQDGFLVLGWGTFGYVTSRASVKSIRVQILLILFTRTCFLFYEAQCGVYVYNKAEVPVCFAHFVARPHLHTHFTCHAIYPNIIRDDPWLSRNQLTQSEACFSWAFSKAPVTYFAFYSPTIYHIYYLGLSPLPIFNVSPISDAIKLLPSFKKACILR